MRNEVDLKSRNDDVIFDDTMRYRYFLRRIFAPTDIGDDAYADDEVILFIMLNPSRADAYRSDNTVSRCVSFAQRWGYRQLWVCNIFAYRSPYPADLYKADDPVGQDNDHYIAMAVRQADEIVVAYGNHGDYRDRGHHVIDIIRREEKQAKAFGLTRQGHPIHPLARGKMWIPYDAGLRKHEDLLIT